jgi:hypothetical protein
MIEKFAFAIGLIRERISRSESYEYHKVAGVLFDREVR